MAASLRPGNAGSNTTTDHIEVLTAVIAQVPAGHRKKVLIRADGAGASHGLMDWLTTLNTAPPHGRRGRSVEYGVGFAVTEQVRAAIAVVLNSAWAAASDADGEVRVHADVVDVTHLLGLTRWRNGMRVIVRAGSPPANTGSTKAWLTLVGIAADPTAWLRLLALPQTLEA